MKNQWLVGMILLSALALVACGPKTLTTDEQSPEVQEPSNDDLNFENNNSNNQNNDLDAGVTDPVVVVDSGVTEEEPEPDPVEETSNGACDNDTDESVLGGLGDDLDGIVGSCALGCLLSSDVSTCGAECVEDDTNLSTGCSNCFGEIIACTAEHCAFPCGLDSQGASCAECRETNCNDAFETCAGISAQ
jgi:hypothetical protein